MAIVAHVSEKLLRRYLVEWSKRMDWSGKWKAIVMGRDGPRGSCGKMVLNRQIFIIGYLQFVEREHLQAALCSNGYRASAGARKLYRRLSMTGISTPLMNGSLEPSGS